MLFFTALLTIAVLGLVVLFVFKHLEERTGKVSFSPVWLKERDAAIEHATRNALKLSRDGCAELCRTLWCAFLTRVRHIFLEIVKKQRQPRVTVRNHKNSAGSVYLKQVMEHKNNLRKGDHQDE